MNLPKLIEHLEQTADTFNALCEYGGDGCDEFDIGDTVEAVSRQAAIFGAPIERQQPLMTPREGLIRIGRLLTWAREQQAPPAMLTVDDVARMLGTSIRHVYRMRDGGKLPPPLKLGALVRWDRSTIERWIADGCKPVRIGKRG